MLRRLFMTAEGLMALYWMVMGLLLIAGAVAIVVGLWKAVIYGLIVYV